MNIDGEPQWHTAAAQSPVTAHLCYTIELSRAMYAFLATVVYFALWAACSSQCTTTNSCLPRWMLRIFAAAPPCFVMTSQGDLLGRFPVTLNKPLICQVWPPDRQRRVDSLLPSWISTGRTASVMATPMVTGRFVRRAAL